MCKFHADSKVSLSDLRKVILDCKIEVMSSLTRVNKCVYMHCNDPISHLHEQWSKVTDMLKLVSLTDRESDISFTYSLLGYVVKEL